MENNFNLFMDESGRIRSDDESVNRILDRIEEEGRTLDPSTLRPAVTFDSESIEVEHKIYLILTVSDKRIDLESDRDINTDENSRDWTICIGRQNTYEYLRSMIEADAIDPNESFILSGAQPIEEALTVFRFMKIMIDNDKVVDYTGFDINDYASYSEDGDKKIVDA